MSKRIDCIFADEHTRLFVGSGCSFNFVHMFYFINIFQNRLFVFRALYIFEDSRIFRCQNHESRTVNRINSGRENGQLFVRILHFKVNFAAVGTTNPVFLHNSYLVRPTVKLAVIKVFKQSVCIVGNLKVPLRQVFLRYRRLASFACAFDNLLVCKYGLAAWAPVYRIFFLICQSLFVELNKNPLHPFIVVFVAGCNFSVPVIGKTEFLQLLFHFMDIVPCPLARMCAVLNRSIFGRQSERVESHRMQDIIAVHLLESCYHIADGVVSYMSHMQFS